MKRRVSFRAGMIFSVCLLAAVSLAGYGVAEHQRATADYSGIEIANEDAIAEGIRTVMKNRSWRAVVTFRARTMDRDGLHSLTDELMERAYGESDDPCGGDYLRFQMGGYELRHSVEKKLFRYAYTVKIQPDYYTTAQQEAAVDERVRKVLADLPLDENASERKKARAVHDFVCDTVAYDTVHKDNKYSHAKTTAYAALFYHTAVCQGYAVLSYRLLKELGVDARIVTGLAEVDGQRERHAWNIVGVDGQYYNMDTTLDAVTETDDYFLKTDAAFAADHERDEAYRTAAFYEQYPMARAAVRRADTARTYPQGVYTLGYKIPTE